ncbi:MAG: SigB/SigF/SigG family RNA polymerase sigma factor [Clostridia bacterium]|nr:SigB/SigF/SigG family RNA polymerase sigma factor [Clostridia bacterium]
MLSRDETVRLIEKAQAGDKEAAETLVAENMPLVKSIAKRYKNSVEYDDLIQLGSLGLYKAIMNFDVKFGVRFSTYAVPMIAGEIKRHIRDEGPIKISRQTKSLAAQIARFTEEYRQKEGREPTMDEIAEALRVESSEVVYAMDSTLAPVSLYEKYDEDGCYLIDTLRTEDQTDAMLDRIMLRQCIKALDERDRKIILLRYYRDKTQSEVAAILGVSQVQVSRLEARIIREMRDKMS